MNSLHQVLVAVLMLTGIQVSVYFLLNRNKKGITPDVNHEEKIDIDCFGKIPNEHNVNSNETPLNRTEDNLAIFYNLFTPDEEEGEKQVLKMIREQMKYRQESVFSNATLYFVSLGKEVTSIENCENCERLEYLPEGDERFTLRKLQDFCKLNTEKDVVYINNIGVLDSTSEYDMLRRMDTKAVFSRGCLHDRHFDPITSSSSCKCNVCSARFSPLPHFHASGNIWVASCSYISKLVSPERIASYMKKVLNTAPKSVFGNITQIQSEAHLGKGKYSIDHWVHSHPDVCPCDVYPGSYTWNFDRIAWTDEWDPILEKAPRFPFMQDYMIDPYLDDLRKIKEGNWFSLPGRLHEWHILYGTLPARDSWIWEFYSQSKEFNTTLG